jgi:peptide chain release factor
MDKIIVQITSGRGPIECCRAVARVQEMMLKQCKAKDIEVSVLDSKKADLKGTLLSATLLAKGRNLQPFVKEWQGTIQWIAQSPYRKFHKRKNWFVGVSMFPLQEQALWNPKDMVVETCRASGPGGQHVNKVETAVRCRHIPSGIQVLAADSRSQLQNKQLGMERLKAKVIAWQTEQLLEQQQDQWQEHNVLERGNAVKVIEAAL